MLAHEEVFKKMADEGLDALEECSHIFLLDGWEKSVGARNEVLAALELGLKLLCRRMCIETSSCLRNIKR